MMNSSPSVSLLLSTFVAGIVGAELHHTTSSWHQPHPKPTFTSCPRKCPPASTKTVTVTASCTSTTSKTPPTSTPTPGSACLLVKPSCQLLQQASGFDVAYYSNVFGPTGFSSQVVQPETPSSYYITENLTPLGTGSTNLTVYPQIYPSFTSTSFPAGPDYPYYDDYTRDTHGGVIVNGNNFTLVYSGFIRAPATGQYQLCTIGDNESDLFFGNGNAFDCNTGKASAKAVPLVKGYFNVYDPTANLVGPCATVDFVQGNFYPIRVVTGNYQGPSAFSLRLVAPGQTADAGTQEFTGLAYPVNCGVYTGL